MNIMNSFMNDARLDFGCFHKLVYGSFKGLGWIYSRFRVVSL